MVAKLPLPNEYDKFFIDYINKKLIKENNVWTLVKIEDLTNELNSKLSKNLSEEEVEEKLHQACYNPTGFLIEEIQEDYDDYYEYMYGITSLGLVFIDE